MVSRCVATCKSRYSMAPKRSARWTLLRQTLGILIATPQPDPSFSFCPLQLTARAGRTKCREAATETRTTSVRHTWHPRCTRTHTRQLLSSFCQTKSASETCRRAGSLSITSFDSYQQPILPHVAVSEDCPKHLLQLCQDRPFPSVMTLLRDCTYNVH